MITVKHKFLSQKPQTSNPGIVSKDEWNDIHIVSQINEVDIAFSSTGHNHDGSSSNYADKAKSVWNSALSLNISNFVSASSLATTNQIPIIDTNNVLNIKKGTPSTSTIAFYNTSVVSSIYEDYTAATFNIKNNVSGSNISMEDAGNININLASGKILNLNSSYLKIINPLTSLNSQYGVRLYENNGTTEKSRFSHIYNSNTSLDYLYLGNITGNISIKFFSNGSGIFDTGAGGKIYYTHGGVAPTSGDEIARVSDFGGSNAAYSVPVSNYVYNTGLYAERAKIYDSLQHIFYIISQNSISNTLNYASNVTLTSNLLIANTITINAGWTLYAAAGKSPLILIANTINIYGTINASGRGSTGVAGGADSDNWAWFGGGGGGGGAGNYLTTVAGNGGPGVIWSQIYGMPDVASVGGSNTTGIYGNSAVANTTRGNILFEHIRANLTPLLYNGSTYSVTSPGGGAGGGSGATFGPAGGYGGGGGGLVILIAKNLLNLASTGTIISKGAPGGAGSYGYSGCGGSGGSGVVLRIAGAFTGTGTVNVSSTAGTSAAGCYSGGGGGAGWTQDFTI